MAGYDDTANLRLRVDFARSLMSLLQLCLNTLVEIVKIVISCNEFQYGS